VSVLKKWFFKHTLLDGGAEYFAEQHIKFASITLSYAAIASIFFSIIESFTVATELILVWHIPLLCLQLANLYLAKRILKNRRFELVKYFSISASISVFWWLGYLFILGWNGASELEVVWRGFIVFLVITFYLNAMQYSMPFLLTNSSTVCLGILIYLQGWTAYDELSYIRYEGTVLIGWYLLLRFGRSNYLVLCDNYAVVAENKKLMDRMDDMLIHDTLTNVHNRRYFDEQLARHMAMFEREHQPFCLAILDIDHFKKVNDYYGHQAGDEVLIQLGQVVRKCLRRSDIFARYGGEEFAVILPLSSLETATDVLSKVRRTVEQHSFDIDEKTIKVTVSLGLTISTENINTKLLIQKADKALYQAKQLGRNTIQIAY
jgi:diguanylate cyclase (GGDEF)-like protein